MAQDVEKAMHQTRKVFCTDGLNAIEGASSIISMLRQHGFAPSNDVTNHKQTSQRTNVDSLFLMPLGRFTEINLATRGLGH